MKIIQSYKTTFITLLLVFSPVFSFADDSQIVSLRPAASLSQDGSQKVEQVGGYGEKGGEGDRSSYKRKSVATRATQV